MAKNDKGDPKADTKDAKADTKEAKADAKAAAKEAKAAAKEAKAAAKGSKPTKGSKDKKPKKTGKANNDFLVQHGEKIAFIAVIALVGFLFYRGYKLPGLEKDKNTEELANLVSAARSNIKSPDSWEALKVEREAPADYPEELKKRYTISRDDYAMIPLKKPTTLYRKKRQDPEILPPQKLIARTFAGPVAMVGVQDMTASDELAPEPEKEEKKKVVRRRRKKKSDGDDMMAAMSGGDEGEGLMEMKMPDNMMGGAGGPGGAPGASGRRYRHKRVGYDPGASGGAMGGMAGMMGGTQTGGAGNQANNQNQNQDQDDQKKDRTPVSVGRTMVAVVGLVPYQKQWDEYQEKLAKSIEYDSGRDQPRYIFLQAQRVEVDRNNPNAPIPEDAWKDIVTTADARKEAARWHGVIRDIIDPLYRATNITLPTPPVMMRDIFDLTIHPEIPLTKPSRNSTNEAQKDEKKPDDKNKSKSGIFSGPSFTENRPQQQGGMGGMGAAMMGGGGDNMMEQMMGGGTDDGEMVTDVIPKYKLVRFFDWNARPGATYRYRVRLLVEDPNNPNTDPAGEAMGIPVQQPPNPRSLSVEVKQRLTKQAKGTFWRQTEFSEPTDPVTIEFPLQVLASKVNPPRMRPTRDKKFYPVTEPTGIVKPVVTDFRRGADIVVDREVARGEMLNFNTNAEYAHPISWSIMLAEDFPFRTNHMVADMRGGQTLAFDKDDKQAAPGEFAIVDHTGKIIVRNQLDDEFTFRKYTFVDDDPPAPDDLTNVEDNEDTTAGMAEMMGGAEDMFGGGNRKKRNR